MIDGFIKNHDLLEEKSKVKDLLSFESTCERFAKKIDSISRSSVIALVGPFGSGKSTMLHQIMFPRLEKELWIEFDAWKYPDRRDLWEGFVLDFAKQVNKKIFNEVYERVTGDKLSAWKTLIQIISAGVNLKFPGGGSVLEKVTYFFKSSPARRVFEIQDVLEKVINGQDKNIFVIIEDIDRSGDAGVFFLETLKQFLRTASLTKKIVVIVPIANDNYHKSISSYLKSIDYFEFFEQSDIKLEQFIDEVFDENLFVGEFKRAGDNRLIWTGENRKKQTISFLEGLFHEMSGVNMRLLKLIIRKANLVYKNQTEDGHDPDFRITLCLEAAKYFKLGDIVDLSYFDDYKKRGVITRGNIFVSYLMAMLINRNSIYETERTGNGEIRRLISSPRDFKFIERVNNDKVKYPSYPWDFGMFDDDKGYGIANFYSKY